MTKPTYWVCAQRRLRSVWASAQSDQSLCCPHEETLGPYSLATHWTHSKDSDQTGRMPRLIWVFDGCTLILLVLSCHGSNRKSLHCLSGDGQIWWHLSGIWTVMLLKCCTVSCYFCEVNPIITKDEQWYVLSGFVFLLMFNGDVVKLYLFHVALHRLSPTDKRTKESPRFLSTHLCKDNLCSWIISLYFIIINSYLQSCSFLDSDRWSNLFHFLMKQKIKLHYFLGKPFRDFKTWQPYPKVYKKLTSQNLTRFFKTSGKESLLKSKLQSSNTLWKQKNMPELWFFLRSLPL